MMNDDDDNDDDDDDNECTAQRQALLDTAETTDKCKSLVQSI